MSDVTGNYVTWPFCPDCNASASGRCGAHQYYYPNTVVSTLPVLVMGLTVEQIEKLKQFFEMHTGRKATDL